MSKFQASRWVRDPRNPIFPPGPDGSFDSKACMNPCCLRIGDSYYLFYAGGQGRARRICLAICPVSDLTRWSRLGPVLELGEPGSFDEGWMVLPTVHRFGATGIGTALTNADS